MVSRSKSVSFGLWVTSGYQVRNAKVDKRTKVFLSRIIITNDDIIRYRNDIPECKNIVIKKPLILDVYI